ncbi:MAG TPA: hypothetical protein VLH56_00945, partial [Dissulfurispiraceae bacterium]|nr:hypothetical protein [Dissulfurispiraceae bacterium]
MGSTSQAAAATKSTFTGYAGSIIETLTAVTSSGVYFNVGDASKILIRVTNASSSDNGSVFVEPGARWAASRGLAPSTTSTLYSTATAPIAVSVAMTAQTASSAVLSTGISVYVGPFESGTVKSSDEKIYVVASTLSTKMYVGVIVLNGGSTQ